MSTITYPDLPENWEWWSETQSESAYTRWFGTEDIENGYEGVVYWDESQVHTITISPIRGTRDDGDPDIAEFPDSTENVRDQTRRCQRCPTVDCRP